MSASTCAASTCRRPDGPYIASVLPGLTIGVKPAGVPSAAVGVVALIWRKPAWAPKSAPPSENWTSTLLFAVRTAPGVAHGFLTDVLQSILQLISASNPTRVPQVGWSCANASSA